MRLILSKDFLAYTLWGIPSEEMIKEVLSVI